MSDIEKFSSTHSVSVKRLPLERVVVHFAGDSGDGMQLAGNQFTQSCAVVGNDIRTYPDFPAEIRAPQGTLPGVSGFQLSFSSSPIYTPGDEFDVLVAMNPAALKVCISRLKRGGILLIDEDKFKAKECKKAGFESALLNTYDSTFRVIKLPMTSLTLEALKEIDISRPKARKCKNLFSLGALYWLFHRPLEDTKEWIKERFQGMDAIIEANIAALRAGYHYAITAELFAEHYYVNTAELPKGEYRQMTGNQALAWGCIAASRQANTPLLVAGYPITPASDILHILAKYPEHGIKTFQAEDEIAACGAAIGAAFAGDLAITTTSGPGMDLKHESLGLAVMTELPMVVVNVQRAGPSTGMPTKVEQADLLSALYGRHGECPLPVLAPSTPGDCFDMTIEAFRIATTYMTPVILLSDAFLANSAEPWKIPDIEALPQISIRYSQQAESFKPYERDPTSLARPWAIPGSKGSEHRIGGLEKEDITGNISYDGDNHEKMISLRAAKVSGIKMRIPPMEFIGQKKGKLLVVGWGSTYGAIRTVVEAYLSQDLLVSALHLKCLNPFPQELGEILQAFEQVVVVELNSGQLCQLLRSKYLVDAKGIHKMQGKPFGVQELSERLSVFLEK